MLFKFESSYYKSRSFFAGFKKGLGLIFLTASVMQTAQAGHSSQVNFQAENVAANVTDRVIIKYKNNTSLNSIFTQPSAVESNAQAHTGVNMQFVRRLHSGAHVMKLQQHKHVAELGNMLSSLNADPEVEYAEADILLKPLLTPNDPRYNEQWGYYENTAGVNLPNAWDVTQGEGAIVAVVDTGYRPHADLVANILPGYDMISDRNVAQDGNGRDSDASDPGDWSPAGACGANSPARNSSWHGTHVAGTVAALGNNGLGVTGVAYQAKILPVRVLGRCGGYTSDIADGIIWAAGGSVAGVPSNLNPADVINLSLGGGGNCGFTQQNAINAARGLGATVVVAAGNANANAASSTPANCNGVITVAAIDRSGGKASYSNFGNVVDIAAPGGGAGNGILSTLNTGSTNPGADTYRYYQGTSMATPHVAGIAALLYSLNPAITPDLVEQTLKSTSRAFPATCSQCGSGIVDASAAISSINGSTPAPTPPPSNSDGLQNGVPVTGIGGARNSQTRYTVDIPANATNLRFNITGGSGDADLYVRYATAPTLSAFDCRPYINGNNETCNMSPVQTGTYHIMLVGYTNFAGVSLTVSYTEPSNAAPPVANETISETGLTGSRGQWQHFTLEVPAGQTSLRANISGGSGDADLYVRFGATPTTRSYNCRPYRNGNNETCNLSNPQAGTWYISLRGYTNYSGVNLNARYLP